MKKKSEVIQIIAGLGSIVLSAVALVMFLLPSPIELCGVVPFIFIVGSLTHVFRYPNLLKGCKLIISWLATSVIAFICAWLLVDGIIGMIIFLAIYVILGYCVLTPWLKYFLFREDMDSPKKYFSYKRALLVFFAGLWFIAFIWAINITDEAERQNKEKMLKMDPVEILKIDRTSDKRYAKFYITKNQYNVDYILLGKQGTPHDGSQAGNNIKFSREGDNIVFFLDTTEGNRKISMFKNFNFPE